MDPGVLQNTDNFFDAFKITKTVVQERLADAVERQNRPVIASGDQSVGIPIDAGDFENMRAIRSRSVSTVYVSILEQNDLDCPQLLFSLIKW